METLRNGPLRDLITGIVGSIVEGLRECDSLEPGRSEFDRNRLKHAHEVLAREFRTLKRLCEIEADFHEQQATQTFHQRNPHE